MCLTIQIIPIYCMLVVCHVYVVSHPSSQYKGKHWPHNLRTVHVISSCNVIVPRENCVNHGDNMRLAPIRDVSGNSVKSDCAESNWQRKLPICQVCGLHRLLLWKSFVGQKYSIDHTARRNKKMLDDENEVHARRSKCRRWCNKKCDEDSNEL